MQLFTGVFDLAMVALTTTIYATARVSCFSLGLTALSPCHSVGCHREVDRLVKSTHLYKSRSRSYKKLGPRTTRIHVLFILSLLQLGIPEIDDLQNLLVEEDIISPRQLCIV